jgi:rhamnosyltransferase
MVTMNQISCVIVTYNTDENIFKVVDSVYKQVDKVIIVDNGSKKCTKLLLQNLSKEYDIKIIYNNKNMGIATAINMGIKEAKKYNSKWVLTLDHDSIVNKDMISNMLKYYISLNESQKEKVGIISPEVLDVSINKSFYKVSDDKDYEEQESVIQSGALIKADLFDKLGYFNEDLFIYFVDIEFCLKIVKSGYKIIMVRGAKLFHEEGKKERKKFLGLEFTYDNYSIQAIYYITRNAIYMFKKYRRYEFLKRVIYDFIKILLAEPKKLQYTFIGIKDGVFDKLGSKEF